MKFEEKENLSQRRYPVVMRFRCTEEDRETAKRRAVETGSSLSTYLRKRAIGGRVNQPVQDFQDIAQMKQGLGLLKKLIQEKREIRPTLKSLETLLAKMIEKIG